MKCNEIISTLKSHRNPKNIEGMARFGINSENTLGVSIPIIRKLAKEIGKDHVLSLELWDTGIHEARLLAGFIGDYKKTTKKQMNSWATDFDSWDICDQVCSNLFDKTEFAYEMAFNWPEDKREYVRRAGFVMMAALSVHDKKADDKIFLKFFPLIKKYSTDDRNFVRKAVNWALRQIGKRSKMLNRQAILLSRQLEKLDSKSARWIAKDALRELTNTKILSRIKK